MVSRGRTHSSCVHTFQCRPFFVFSQSDASCMTTSSAEGTTVSQSVSCNDRSRCAPMMVCDPGKWMVPCLCLERCSYTGASNDAPADCTYGLISAFVLSICHTGITALGSGSVGLGIGWGSVVHWAAGFVSRFLWLRLWCCCVAESGPPVF